MLSQNRYIHSNYFIYHFLKIIVRLLQYYNISIDIINTHVIDYRGHLACVVRENKTINSYKRYSKKERLSLYFVSVMREKKKKTPYLRPLRVISGFPSLLPMFVLSPLKK